MVKYAPRKVYIRERLSYMKSKGAGNKAHLQPVTHLSLIHI